MKAEDFINLIEQGRFDKISNNGLELIAKRFKELESEVLTIPVVSNCGGAIPYDSLSDSFKKSIDSIEDNLNK
jgi:hypothetical protein